MNAAALTPEDDFMSPEWLEQRASDLEAQSAHALMKKDNATLDDAGLADFLQGAIIQGRADHGCFEILFGYDQNLQDFLIAKGKPPCSLHFVLLA